MPSWLLTWMLATVWLGAGATGGALAQGSPPRVRVTLVVNAALPTLEKQATRVHRAATATLRRNRAIEFVDPDEVLDGGLQKDDPWQPVRRLFEQGRQAYENLELDQSVNLLVEASRAMESRLQNRIDRELFTEVYTYLGAALELQGKRSRSDKVFQKLVVFNREAKLNPLIFPPALGGLFAQTIAEVSGRGVGVWSIEARPEGAEIWIDGVFRGISPLEIPDLKEGEHFLRLARRGYRSFGHRHEVLEGSEELIQHEMDPLPGLGRLLSLVKSLEREAASPGYPVSADELMRWMAVDRLLFVRVETDGLHLHGLDGKTRRRRDLVVRQADADGSELEARLEPAIAAAIANAGIPEGVSATTVRDDPVRHPTPGAGPDTGADPPRRQGEQHASIWASWWFWTLAGVVVAGGVGLGLALGLDAPDGPRDGEVIFRF